MEKIKPILVVSRCLGFEACRWNGAIIPSELINLLRPHVDMITPCPEVEIGLGVPREPIRIIRQDGGQMLFQPAEERDVTRQMQSYSSRFIRELEDVDGFILKSKSPSCGTREVSIYPRKGKVAATERGSGFFGGAILNAFADLPVESEGRLLNYRIREHFLTHVYTRARFRRLMSRPSMKGLVEFQARHKFIFLACSQKHMREMGRLVANPDKKPLDELLPEYQTLMNRVFEKIPRFSAHINVMEHAFGYISRKILPGEKTYFLNLLEDYRNERFPLSALLAVLKSWIIRFNEAYLMDQFYFEPFPRNLVEITDSGKGRKLSS
jgi:uncharacterized protein YbgA (DUF1722 family)/uncharacterized protein YbbK (DUF523 family)